MRLSQLPFAMGITSPSPITHALRPGPKLETIQADRTWTHAISSAMQKCMRKASPGTLVAECQPTEHLFLDLVHQIKSGKTEALIQYGTSTLAAALLDLLYHPTDDEKRVDGLDLIYQITPEQRIPRAAVLQINDQTQLVAFAGSLARFEDWYSNICLSKKVIDHATGYDTHEGVLKRLDETTKYSNESLWDQLCHTISQHHRKDVIFAGHSIGATMAKVAAMRFEKKQIARTKAIYLFSPPNLCTQSMAELTEKTQTHIYVCAQDFLPKLAFTMVGYLPPDSIPGRTVHINVPHLEYSIKAHGLMPIGEHLMSEHMDV